MNRQVLLKAMQLTLVLLLLTGSILMIARRVVRHGLEPTPIPGLWVRTYEIGLGKIQAGRAATAQIELINKRIQPLQVDSIAADCGCAVVKLPQQPIPQGGNLTLPVTFSPNSFLGSNRSKTVALSVSGPGIAQEKLVFSFTASVDHAPFVAAIPATVELGNLAPEMPAGYSSSFYLSGPRGLVDSVPDVVFLDSLADKTITLHYRSINPDSASKRIAIKLSTLPNSFTGLFSVKLNFHFVGPRQYDTQVEVTGSVSPSRVVSEPTRLYFACDGLSTRHHLLSLAAQDGGSIDIEAIECGFPVTWSVQRRSPRGDRLTLQVVPRLPEAIPTARTSCLKIKFRNTAAPLNIPFTVVPIQPLRNGDAFVN